MPFLPDPAILSASTNIIGHHRYDHDDPQKVTEHLSRENDQFQASRLRQGHQRQKQSLSDASALQSLIKLVRDPLNTLESLCHDSSGFEGKRWAKKDPKSEKRRLYNRLKEVSQMQDSVKFTP